MGKPCRRRAFSYTLLVEIRERSSLELVTVVEILSPSNKRPHSVSRQEYLAKRDVILTSNVHLLEIDLLRGGAWLPMGGPLPPADFYVILSRTLRRPTADVWPFTLRDRLPTVPVPLADEDADVHLDLQRAFDTVYDRVGYDYSLDYRRAVEPPLSEGEATWAKSIVSA